MAADYGNYTHLEALKYCADIVWYKYNAKQDQEDPTLALVNTDVLDVVLLSLHPKGQIKKKDISEAAKIALSEISKFKDLILLEDYSEMEAQTWKWVKAASSDKMSKSYSAQMCLMTWFLTLVSKITGVKIPGIQKLMVGGRILKEREEMVMYITTIITITQAMSEKNNWNFLAQYSKLKQMQKDLNGMIIKF